MQPTHHSSNEGIDDFGETEALLTKQKRQPKTEKIRLFWCRSIDPP